LDRSQTQLDALGAQIDAFTGRVQHGVTHDVTHAPDPENSRQEIYRRRVLREPPFLDWPLSKRAGPSPDPIPNRERRAPAGSRDCVMAQLVAWRKMVSALWGQAHRL
jgi:hypothetical protein